MESVQRRWQQQSALGSHSSAAEAHSREPKGLISLREETRTCLSWPALFGLKSPLLESGPIQSERKVSVIIHSKKGQRDNCLRPRLACSPSFPTPNHGSAALKSNPITSMPRKPASYLRARSINPHVGLPFARTIDQIASDRWKARVEGHR